MKSMTPTSRDRVSGRAITPNGFKSRSPMERVIASLPFISPTPKLLSFLMTPLLLMIRSFSDLTLAL